MPTNGGVSDSDAALFVRLVQTNVDPALVWLVPCLVGVSGCLFKKAILWSTWAREEPCTLTQGASVFPGSSCLGIKPKTPGCLVQDLTTSPSGIWSPPRAGRGGRDITLSKRGSIREHRAEDNVVWIPVPELKRSSVQLIAIPNLHLLVAHLKSISRCLYTASGEARRRE